MNLSHLPSPCYVVELAALRRNLGILRGVSEDAGCTIVLALKGFSMWSVFPLIRQYLKGCCASGIWEARLAREEFGGEVLTYSPAYKDDEIADLLEITDHLDFNSPGQWERFRAMIMGHPRFQNGALRCGLRINPECSTGQTAIYDPCVAGSRLGITAAALAGMDLTGISGLHFHTLCEQGSEDLETTLEAVEEKFGHILARPEITWVNMGGGHWITKPDYNRELLIRLVREFSARWGVHVFLEPGEAIAIHTGVLRATVVDITHNALDIAILDVSATAHMPDVLEMPYRPAVFLEGENEPAGEPGSAGHLYRLGGPTCLAGDIIGDYVFPRPLVPGDMLVFDDMAHYTMVKTTTFNGVRHPAIATVDPESGETRVVREFRYEDYRDRLS
jgi:carboxynorspermidine decarboxylase